MMRFWEGLGIIATAILINLGVRVIHTSEMQRTSYANMQEQIDSVVVSLIAKQDSLNLYIFAYDACRRIDVCRLIDIIPLYYQE